jgi:hypothetical protein
MEYDSRGLLKAYIPASAWRDWGYHDKPKSGIAGHRARDLNPGLAEYYAGAANLSAAYLSVVLKVIKINILPFNYRW